MAHDRAPIHVAARLLRIPPGTIRRWVAEGRLTSTGKPHTVSLSEVHALRELLRGTGEQ